MENKKRLNQILSEIQIALVAKKDQRNEFGKYNYRNCEGILAAVKPYLEKHNLAIVLGDEIMSLDNGKVYIKATATIMSDDDEISVSAYAREADTLKGMSDGQITGATSSYARKYALCGLLAIDDNDDLDKVASKPDNDYAKKIIGQINALKLASDITAFMNANPDVKQNKEIYQYALNRYKELSK